MIIIRKMRMKFKVKCQLTLVYVNKSSQMGISANEEQITPCATLLKSELAQQVLKTPCTNLKTLKLEVPCILAAPVLVVCPKDIKSVTARNVCIPMLGEA